MAAVVAMSVAAGVLSATPAGAAVPQPSIPYQGFAWIAGPYCAFGQGTWSEYDDPPDVATFIGYSSFTFSMRGGGCTIPSPATTNIFAAQAVLLTWIPDDGRWVTCQYVHEYNLHGQSYVSADGAASTCGPLYGCRYPGWFKLQAQWRITYHGGPWNDFAESNKKMLYQC